LWFLADRHVISVSDADEIQQASNDDVFRPVVRGGMCHNYMSPVVDAAKYVESAGAHVANEAENVENVSTVRLIDPPLHEDPEHEHGDNRTHQKKAANPAFLNEVSG